MTPDVLLIRKLMARQDLTRAETGELLTGLLATDGEGWRFLAFSVASHLAGPAAARAAERRPDPRRE